MAHKLLLADDSITIQKVVELVLAEEDFEIKSVSNGEDALNLLNSFMPDVVLADIEMPKVNGYNLCEKIKKNRSTSNVPVILLAGAFEPIDEELAKHVGADDSIIKPFESQELISKINAVLTMVTAEAQEAIPAEEEALEAVEETEVFAEPDELFGMGENEVEAVEATEAEMIGEDLWAMEEIAEAVVEPKETMAEEIQEAFGATEEPAVKPAFKPEAVLKGGVPPASKAPVMTDAELPSKDELLRRFEQVIDKKVSAAISGLDVREALVSSMIPALKETVEKVIWEIAPEIADKVLKEILRSSIASLTKEVEKVIWETVPDLANTLISKEIEKIKSEI